MGNYTLSEITNAFLHREQLCAYGNRQSVDSHVRDIGFL